MSHIHSPELTEALAAAGEIQEEQHGVGDSVDGEVDELWIAPESTIRKRAKKWLHRASNFLGLTEVFGDVRQPFSRYESIIVDLLEQFFVGEGVGWVHAVNAYRSITHGERHKLPYRFEQYPPQNVRRSTGILVRDGGANGLVIPADAVEWGHHPDVSPQKRHWIHTVTIPRKLYVHDKPLYRMNEVWSYFCFQSEEDKQSIRQAVIPAVFFRESGFAAVHHTPMLNVARIYTPGANPSVVGTAFQFCRDSGHLLSVRSWHCPLIDQLSSSPDAARTFIRAVIRP